MSVKDKFLKGAESSHCLFRRKNKKTGGKPYKKLQVDGFAAQESDWTNGALKSSKNQLILSRQTRKEKPNV